LGQQQGYELSAFGCIVPGMTNVDIAALGRKPKAGCKKYGRSRVGNGSELLSGIDGRSATYRRFRDLVADIAGDLGGVDRLSELERQLIRRAAMLSAECEKMEAAAARGEEFDSQLYGMMADRIGRIAQRLGLSRLARDVEAGDRSLAEMFRGVESRRGTEIEG
jgi:hypothetical protein